MVVVVVVVVVVVAAVVVVVVAAAVVTHTHTKDKTCFNSSKGQDSAPRRQYKTIV